MRSDVCMYCMFNVHGSWIVMLLDKSHSMPNQQKNADLFGFP